MLPLVLSGAMNNKSKDAYLYRAKLVLSNLINCNSAAEVHRVGNMRNIATLLIDMLGCGTGYEEIHIKPVLERLEVDQKKFFKKKYANIQYKES